MTSPQTASASNAFPGRVPKGAAELAILDVVSQLGMNPTRMRGDVEGTSVNGDALQCNGFNAPVSHRRCASFNPTPTTPQNTSWLCM